MIEYCQGCGEELRPNQEVCTNCGRIIKRKKTTNQLYYLIAGLIIIITGLIMCVYSGEYDEEILGIAPWVIVGGMVTLCNSVAHDIPKLAGILSSIILIACGVSVFSVFQSLGLIPLELFAFAIINIVFLVI